jgi:hypothetical protein
MGNSGSTISAKNFDASRMPVALSNNGHVLAAQDAVIFNAGIREIAGFSGNPVIHMTLSVNGYRNQSGSTASAGMATGSMLQKGYTFALDKNQLDSAQLHIRIMNGAQVIAEKHIPVRTLQYSGQKHFNETISFGLLPQGQNWSQTAVPTVKMSFEILSRGDGKVFMAKKPHFMDLELARSDGQAHTQHPLGMAIVR